MRSNVYAAALAAILLTSGSAHADWRCLFGFHCGGDWVRVIANDTGGIIPWSPQAELDRFAIAGDHCARYSKIAHITSVHRQYGDYIGFVCQFPPGYDPERMRGNWYALRWLNR